MGMITDFFAASPSQLRDAFAGWYTVSAKNAPRTVTSPFTGEKQQINDWQPDKLVKNGKDNAFENIRSLPHAELGRIDHVKVATLDGLLNEADFDESMDVISIPALLPPQNNGECGLQEVPSRLVVTLAALESNVIKEVAKKWQKTEEMKADRFKPSDCEEVLRHLCRVAKVAKAQKEKMYLLWSL